MSDLIAAYPLAWPAGWPRTSARSDARFSKYGKSLSVYDGVTRVLKELESLGIKRDDMVISTNVETRMDGFPRSDRGNPADPGVAVNRAWDEFRAQRGLA